MEHEEARKVLLTLLELSDHLRERDDRLMQQLVHAIGELHSSAQGVIAGGQHLAADALDVLRREGGAAVQQGVDQALQRSRASMEAFTNTGSQAAREVQAAAQALRQQRGIWLWAAPIALITGSLLAAGGSSFFAWKSLQDVRRAGFAKDILAATQNGTLTRCGEALCAKVGQEPQRYGRGGEYVLLSGRGAR